MKRLVEAGMIWLRTNQQTVNALNVFPVPDGDTGTNMVLTMQSAWNEIKDAGYRSISDMAAAVSRGALMGARGNSGVILSQLWRGFARGVHGKDILDGETLARAFGEARDTAYKGVVRPVEGTILTVAREVALATEAALKSTQDPIQILEAGWAALLLVAAVGLWSRRPFPGAIFLGAAGAYALARVVLQPAREAQDRLGPVNLQRTFAAALGILALLGLIVTWLGSSRNT